MSSAAEDEDLEDEDEGDHVLHEWSSDIESDSDDLGLELSNEDRFKMEEALAGMRSRSVEDYAILRDMLEEDGEGSVGQKHPSIAGGTDQAVIDFMNEALKDNNINLDLDVSQLGGAYEEVGCSYIDTPLPSTGPTPEQCRAYGLPPILQEADGFDIKSLLHDRLKDADWYDFPEEMLLVPVEEECSPTDVAVPWVLWNLRREGLLPPLPPPASDLIPEGGVQGTGRKDLSEPQVSSAPNADAPSPSTRPTPEQCRAYGLPPIPQETDDPDVKSLLHGKLKDADCYDFPEEMLLVPIEGESSPADVAELGYLMKLLDGAMHGVNVTTEELDQSAYLITSSDHPPWVLWKLRHEGLLPPLPSFTPLPASDLVPEGGVKGTGRKDSSKPLFPSAPDACADHMCSQGGVDPARQAQTSGSGNENPLPMDQDTVSAVDPEPQMHLGPYINPVPPIMHHECMVSESELAKLYGLVGPNLRTSFEAGAHITPGWRRKARECKDGSFTMRDAAAASLPAHQAKMEARARAKRSRYPSGSSEGHTGSSSFGVGGPGAPPGSEPEPMSYKNEMLQWDRVIDEQERP
eukprot:gene22535-29662_t